VQLEYIDYLASAFCVVVRQAFVLSLAFAHKCLLAAHTDLHLPNSKIVAKRKVEVLQV